jgi:glucan-binding YG repeat protein
VVFTVKGYKYYAGTNGAIATNGLTKTKSGNTVFATSSGKLKVNKTFTYKGVKYKANKKGVVTKVK